MTFIVWFAMLGAVLLLLALSSSYLRWIPVTSSVVCLALGIGLGTSGLGLLQLDLSKSSGCNTGAALRPELGRASRY